MGTVGRNLLDACRDKPYNLVFAVSELAQAVFAGTTAFDFGPVSPQNPHRSSLSLSPIAPTLFPRHATFICRRPVPCMSCTSHHPVASCSLSLRPRCLHSVHSLSTPCSSGRGPVDAGIGVDMGAGPLPARREQNIIAPSWTTSSDGVWQPSLPNAAPSPKVKLITLDSRATPWHQQGKGNHSLRPRSENKTFSVVGSLRRAHVKRQRTKRLSVGTHARRTHVT